MSKESPKYIIFGGAGYIGSSIARSLPGKDVVLVDTTQPAGDLSASFRYIHADIREPIAGELLDFKPDWIFNLAAVHREPGHKDHEYFDTNIPGARNICDYANAVACNKLYFTSSIATYGPVQDPTDENAPKYPQSPYGISKLVAELIHEGWWREASKERRLIVCRPGVVYGPGDPGNILRLIRAVRKRRFFYPGDPEIRKSYAYIDGLLESIHFTMNAEERFITYNYVENKTEPLNQIVKNIQAHFDAKYPIPRIPRRLLILAASTIHLLTGGNSPIHPTPSTTKASLATNIIPQKLIDMGFEFKFPFARTLKLWEEASPEDFKL